jgi:hypothetical protein
MQSSAHLRDGLYSSWHSFCSLFFALARSVRGRGLIVLNKDCNMAKTDFSSSPDSTSRNDKLAILLPLFRDNTLAPLTYLDFSYLQDLRRTRRETSVGRS